MQVPGTPSIAITCSIASLALANISVNSASLSFGTVTPILDAVCCSTSLVTGDCLGPGESVVEAAIFGGEIEWEA